METLGCCISQGHGILMRKASNKNKQPNKEDVCAAGNIAGEAELNKHCRSQMKPTYAPGT